MGMTPKENMLALNHQPHDRIPNYLTDVMISRNPE